MPPAASMSRAFKEEVGYSDKAINRPYAFNITVSANSRNTNEQSRRQRERSSRT